MVGYCLSRFVFVLSLQEMDGAATYVNMRRDRFPLYPLKAIKKLLNVFGVCRHVIDAQALDMMFINSENTFASPSCSQHGQSLGTRFLSLISVTYWRLFWLFQAPYSPLVITFEHINPSWI